MSTRTRIYLSEAMYASHHTRRLGVSNEESTLETRMRVSHWSLFKHRVRRFFKKDSHPYNERFLRLPEIKVEIDMKPTEGCSICLDDYLFDQRIKILPCLHYYHKHCIRKWLCERENSCPMCRMSV